MDLMTNLPRLAIFATVVKAGSFTKAAQRLGIGKAAVSKQVQALEESLGVRLLNRTTRSLGLTATGERVFAHCEQLLEEAKSVSQLVEGQSEAPRGTLRIASPLDFGRKVLVPAVGELLENHPDLNVHLLFNDQIIDFVDAGVDVAVRIGFLRDSSLIVKKLWMARYHLYASPEYVARHGAPKTPADTLKHPWMLLDMTASLDQWVFRSSEETCAITAPSRMRVDSSIGVVEAVCRGIGIAPFLDFLAAEEVSEGRLVRLLPDYTLDPDIHVYVSYAHRRFQPAKVHALIECLQRRVLALGEASKG